MLSRVFAVALLVALAGCQWEGRPDGAEANHSNEVDMETAFDATVDQEAEIIEPLDGEPIEPRADAPVDLTQPPPTTGTADNTNEVEEALTPGTEQ